MPDPKVAQKVFWSFSESSAVLPVSQPASRAGKRIEGRTEALSFSMKLFDSELEDLSYVSLDYTFFPQSFINKVAS